MQLSNSGGFLLTRLETNIAQLETFNKQTWLSKTAISFSTLHQHTIKSKV